MESPNISEGVARVLYVAEVYLTVIELALAIFVGIAALVYWAIHHLHVGVR